MPPSDLNQNRNAALIRTRRGSFQHQINVEGAKWGIQICALKLKSSGEVNKHVSIEVIAKPINDHEQKPPMRWNHLSVALDLYDC